jgi:tRNA A37 threonylcarbamoyladenosine biosynthesis protein TsaE
LGIEEFFADPQMVTAIEWGDKVKEIWPKKVEIIDIQALAEDERMFKISCKVQKDI